MDTASLQSFNNAVNLAQAGKKAEAHGILGQVLLSYPENISVLLWLVFTSPDYATARRYLEKAHQVEPANPSVVEAFRWINLAASPTSNLGNSVYAAHLNGNSKGAAQSNGFLHPTSELVKPQPTPLQNAPNEPSFAPSISQSKLAEAQSPTKIPRQPYSAEIPPSPQVAEQSTKIPEQPYTTPLALQTYTPATLRAESDETDTAVVVKPRWLHPPRLRRPKIIPLPVIEPKKSFWQRRKKFVLIGAAIGIVFLIAAAAGGFFLLRPKNGPLIIAATTPLPIIPNAIRKFDFAVLDSAYSQTLDKLILLGRNQNRIHILDPNNGGDVTVVFTKIALAVAVSQDGKYAAVGHAGQISYVDLQTATIAKVFDYPETPASLALASNGWIYVSPDIRGKSEIVGIEVASGRTASVAGEYIYGRTVLKVHPNGKSLYGASRSLNPSVIIKLDISKGAPNYFYSSFDNPFNKEFEGCGNFWFSSDGNKIFTACGTVMEASDDKTKDLAVSGRLENMQNVLFATQAEPANRLLVVGSVTRMENPGEVTGYGVRVYNYDELSFANSIQLPDFEVSEKNYSSAAIAVYYNPGTNRYFAILQTNEKKINQYGLLVGDLK